jgi:hypothetical protein
MSLNITKEEFVIGGILIGGILLASFCIAGLAYNSISIGFNSLDALQETSNRLDASPYIKASAIITSKDSDGRLSLKSSALPKGGDRIVVDQYVYGAVSTGDRVCVQFKTIPEVPDGQQYGTEFVGLGSCSK